MELLDLISFLENIFSSYGYLIIFISSFIEISPFGWAIPGGVILSVGGFFSHNDGISLWGVIFFGWLGAWLTFLLAYLLGRKTGLFLVRKFKQEKNAKDARHLLSSHGPEILTTSLMANFTRFWIAYIAGVERYSISKFVLYSGFSSLVWASFMVLIGYLAGGERSTLESSIKKIAILPWIFLLLALITIAWSIKREYKKFQGGKTS